MYVYLGSKFMKFQIYVQNQFFFYGKYVSRKQKKITKAVQAASSLFEKTFQITSIGW
jgi:hypothetical protein